MASRVPLVIATGQVRQLADTLALPAAFVEKVVALSDGANIATDASLGNIFTVTLGGNRTLDNPTNPTAGQKAIWIITQDGSGGRTLAYGSDFSWSTDVPLIVLSTGINKIDFIGAIYHASKWRVVAYTKGF